VAKELVRHRVQQNIAYFVFYNMFWSSWLRNVCSWFRAMRRFASDKAVYLSRRVMWRTRRLWEWLGWRSRNMRSVCLL